MKINKKIISAFVLLSTFLGSCIAANAAEYSVNRSFGQDKITISGKAEKNELFSVQILQNGVTPKDIENDPSLGGIKSIFSKTLTADENGDFSFDVKIAESGEYVVYLRASSEETPPSEKIAFVLEAEKTTAVSDIISKLNTGVDVDAVSYVKDFFCDDAVFTDYVTKFASTQTQKDYFLKKMQNKSITDYTGLKTAAKEALILMAAKDSDGPANLKEVMMAYNDVLNISSFSSKISIYTSIKGEYADINAFKVAYNKAVTSSSTDGSGGSSGGGGGSSSGGGFNASGAYTSAGVGSVQTTGITTNKTATPINIKFEDLASVEWAYSDISELFDKGIVSGVSEHLYRPNISVKREEFVKMLVCAMGLQNELADDAGFTDVETGAWYESYVNIAKKFGISTGTGDNKFGVGHEISRQDMAVMIYNSMKICGYISTGAENSFADKGSCAGYTIDAIAELSQKGIVSGVGDNLFEPLGKATRAQAAVIINRALPYLVWEAVK